MVALPRRRLVPSLKWRTKTHKDTDNFLVTVAMDRLNT
jgi:hypothetical protein